MVYNISNFTLLKDKMTLHNDFLFIRGILGYKDNDGVCHGLSICALEAFLTNEKNYQKRIKKIRSYACLLREVFQRSKIPLNKAKLTKTLYHYKQKIISDFLFSLSIEDRNDLYAFFNSIELFDNAAENREIFQKNFSQLQIDAISPFASSDSSLSQGGLKTIFSQALIPTQKELAEYLKSLGALIKKNKVEKYIGVLMCAYDHTQALIYASNLLKFLDVNLDSEIISSDHNLIAKKIIQDDKYLPLNIVLISTNDKLNDLGVFINEMEQFRKDYPITKAIVKRSTNNINLLHVASEIGQTDLIKPFINLGGNPNLMNDARGDSPLIAATYFERTGFIKSLVSHEKVLVNQQNYEKEGAIHWAVKFNYTDIIHTLDKHQEINFNLLDNNIKTPLHIAVDQDNYEALQALYKSKHEVDITLQDINGKTPLENAILNGNKKMINFLLKWAKEKNHDLSKLISESSLIQNKKFIKKFPELTKLSAFSLFEKSTQNKTLVSKKIDSGESEKKEYICNKPLKKNAKLNLKNLYFNSSYKAGEIPTCSSKRHHMSIHEEDIVGIQKKMKS